MMWRVIQEYIDFYWSRYWIF